MISEYISSGADTHEDRILPKTKRGTQTNYTQREREIDPYTYLFTSKVKNQKVLRCINKHRANEWSQNYHIVENAIQLKADSDI